MNRKRFEEIIMAPDLSGRLAEDRDFRKELFGIHPAVPRMDFPQRNVHHDYTVLFHTAHTVDSVSADGLTDREYRDVRVAAFFHDIAKPEVARRKQDSRGYWSLSFPGHPEKGVSIAVEILTGMGWQPSELSRIRFYIAAHDLFLPLRHRTDSYIMGHPGLEITKENIAAVIRRYRDRHPELVLSVHDFTVLLALSTADMAAHAEISWDPPRTGIGIDGAGRVIREVPKSTWITMPNGERVRERVIDTRRAKVDRAQEIRVICRELESEDSRR